MAGKPVDERTFTEEEVGEILRRAVEDPSRALVPREGITLAELRSIGEEVGIDPSRIDEAARSLTSGVATPLDRVLGGPTVVGCERKVHGVVGTEDAPAVLAAIRAATGLQGEMREIPGALEWSASGESSERRITISSRGNETTIHASANLAGAAAVTFVPAGIVTSMISLIGLLVFLKKGSESGLFLVLLLPILYTILSSPE